MSPLLLPASTPQAFLPNLVGMDGLVILVLGLLIFGRRLPEVGKNLGKTIVEFKKGLSGGYSGSDDATPPEPEEPANTRRLSSGSKVSVNQNFDNYDQKTRTPAPARPAKRLPETEEV
jgi:sec-independent protein translocase protein TatA